MTTLSRLVHRPHPEIAEAPGAMLTSTAARALAFLRLSTAFVFLWAFFDKTFGWNYHTASADSWMRGGSPTKGFLGFVDVGPMKSFFNDIAGKGWTDWLFMLGLLGIGLALALGIGMRLAAVAGVVMMALMWLAEYPLARFTESGDPTGSVNPLTDYHFIYAAVLVVLALTYAGDAWGFGRMWGKLPLVQRYRWLR